jgi:hypothetical protein
MTNAQNPNAESRKFSVLKQRFGAGIFFVIRHSDFVIHSGIRVSSLRFH